MNPSLTTNRDKIASKVKAAFPRADALGFDIEGLAALSYLPLATVDEYIKQPGVIEELTAEKLRAESDGSLLEVRSLMLTGKVLDRIGAQIDSMDAFEATEVSKPLLRILEAADKRRAALKDDSANLPIFNITIDLSSSRPTISYGASPPDSNSGVHDVESRLIDDGEGSSWV